MPRTNRKPIARLSWRAGALAALLPGTTLAQDRARDGAVPEVVVNIAGVTAASGTVRCALFAGAEGFPKDDQYALQVVRVSVQAAGPVTCRFPGVPDGRYAIAVAHDVNGNGRVDANLVGQPTEPWAVTNGVRPRFGPPRFEEAAIDVSSSTTGRTIQLQVAR